MMKFLNIKRKILLNPGPATTTDTVKYSQVVSDICPREKEFEILMGKIRQDLLKVVDADSQKYVTVLFAGSGTLCIDVLISSLVDDDSQILIINNGSYSQRAVDVCKYYGINFCELRSDDDCHPSLSQIDEILKNNKQISVVYATHHETGTGLLNPVREIGRIVHENKKIFTVDTTSSFAMIPINIERDNIDFLMSSSQKGVMAMAGIAFVIGDIQLIKKSRNFPKRSYYSNLYRQYEYFERTGQMNFTPPVQTIYSLNQALCELFEESLEVKYARHRRAFDTLRDGLAKLGFKFYVDDELNGKLLLSIIYPKSPNWSFEKIHDFCYDKGYTIYPGKVVDKPMFRLSVYGALDYKDINRFLLTFKKALLAIKVEIPVRY